MHKISGYSGEITLSCLANVSFFRVWDVMYGVIFMFLSST
jgi:hypothetical protein